MDATPSPPEEYLVSLYDMRWIFVCFALLLCAVVIADRFVDWDSIFGHARDHGYMRTRSSPSIAWLVHSVPNPSQSSLSANTNENASQMTSNPSAMTTSANAQEMNPQDGNPNTPQDYALEDDTEAQSLFPMNHDAASSHTPHTFDSISAYASANPPNPVNGTVSHHAIQSATTTTATATTTTTTATERRTYWFLVIWQPNRLVRAKRFFNFFQTLLARSNTVSHTVNRQIQGPAQLQDRHNHESFSRITPRLLRSQCGATTVSSPVRRR
eukprot:TRINITY_DN4681_c0_g1_i1.p1 TRINITY_DN4681_c0_g1~~TRINITY_DN4681_c0_g1_i1.p1  ORF type:complete len:270 (-),score=63.14 TRINITY_DN4681_c0_g1_i1:645-1454(-)